MLGPQFEFLHSKNHEGEEHLGLVDNDNPTNNPLARVRYIDDKRNKTIHVGFVKSYEEGKGHTRTLMGELYSRYPEHQISWGRTVSPATTHLAEDFQKKQGRTTWEQAHG